MLKTIRWIVKLKSLMVCFQATIPEKINETIAELFASNESLRNDFGKVMAHFKGLYSGMFNPGDIRAAWMAMK